MQGLQYTRQFLIKLKWRNFKTKNIHLKRLYILSIISLGCSLTKESDQEFFFVNQGPVFTYDHYKRHTDYWVSRFIKSNSTQISEISRRNKQYLKSVVDNIISKNELFFTQIQSIRFIIVRDKRPFVSSIPSNHIIISDSFIGNYLYNENYLYIALTYELVRLEKGVFQSQMKIPTETVSLSDLIKFSRISTSLSFEVHKWSKYLLSRIGVQSDSYLSWLQVINRNQVDFRFHLHKVNIYKIEKEFKKIIISNLDGEYGFSRYKKSSKSFYDLVHSYK